MPYIHSDWTDSYLDSVLSKISVLEDRVKQDLTDEQKQEIMRELVSVQAELIAISSK